MAIEINGEVYRTEAQWEKRHRHVRAQSRKKGVCREWRKPSGGKGSAVFYREEQTRPWSKKELAKAARERKEARERKKLEDAYERGYRDAEALLMPLLDAQRAIAEHRYDAHIGLVEAYHPKKYDRIVIDTETTGLTCDDELLQVAITDGEGNELHNGLYRPRRLAAWPDAQAVNGIGPEDVAGCGHASSDRRWIQNLVDEAEQVCVYNAEFDVPFLERIGVDFLGARVHCTMREFASLYGQWDERFDDYKWQTLATAARHTGYRGQGRAHDALEDCRMAAHVQRWCDAQRLAETSE